MSKTVQKLKERVEAAKAILPKNYTEWMPLVEEHLCAVDNNIQSGWILSMMMNGSRTSDLELTIALEKAAQDYQAQQENKAA